MIEVLESISFVFSQFYDLSRNELIELLLISKTSWWVSKDEPYNFRWSGFQTT